MSKHIKVLQKHELSNTRCEASEMSTSTAVQGHATIKPVVTRESTPFLPTQSCLPHAYLSNKESVLYLIEGRGSEGFLTIDAVPA